MKKNKVQDLMLGIRPEYAGLGASKRTAATAMAGCPGKMVAPCAGQMTLLQQPWPVVKAQSAYSE